MPERTASNHIRLGLFVLAGLGCLVATLLLLARKQSLFSSSLPVQADFRNVAGLVTGNNVRLAGIDVGTVRRINILNDSTVRVELSLNRDVQPFVKKNAVASIGTDGLVGNTIVNLTAVAAPARPVEPGDVLRTTAPLAIDEMLSTLNVSNKNLIGITQDLRQITSKLNGSDALWQLLGDEQLVAHARQSLQHAAAAAGQLQQSAQDVRQLTSGLREGRGPMGYLLTDTAFAGQLRHATRQLAGTSDTLARTLATLQRQVQTGAGPLNTLLTDTALSRQLRQSMLHVEQGTAGFNQSMEALQHNFLLRGYLRRQQKKQTPPAYR
ncbi:MlaD family protein [Hymenobacter koreensis]|uniref:Mce/MlaD domain-containing protein n=1 Tax=Hymenobacter koreensis TaxID=1084523 RepID=A0ABP8J672_9BACT